jgi:hypothetical protein
LKKIALFLMKAEENWLDKKVINSATGRTVKIKSLPPEERAKYHPKTGLHAKAKKGDLSVLKHKDVGTVQDSSGDTPLHHMVRHLKKEELRNVLKHPDIDKTKNKQGDTPWESYFWDR